MPADRCRVCERGPEACQYCENLSSEDWESICDCGLYDFGHHIGGTCRGADAYRYVIATDHDTAFLPRVKP